MRPLLPAVFVSLLTVVSCSSQREGQQLHVAAAANLQRAMDPLSSAFRKAGGANVVPSFGSSTQLAQQVENGGPFDLFLSADTAQIDRLASKGLIVDGTRAVYARGVLVLWAPRSPGIHSLRDLAKPEVKRIGIANPELAPYGKAAVETLTSLQLWPSLQPKVVYGPNISVVAQFAESANADASFTALALITDQPTTNRVAVPENLHQPIEQGLGVLRAAKEPAAARAFRDFLLGAQGQAIFAKFGYGPPSR